MTWPKALHLLRLILIAIVAGIALFWMGWHMGKNQHRLKAIEVLKTGTPHEAALAVADWYSKDPNATDCLEYYVALAAIAQKTGKHDVCQAMLAEALKFMGK